MLALRIISKLYSNNSLYSSTVIFHIMSCDFNHVYTLRYLEKIKSHNVLIFKLSHVTFSGTFKTLESNSAQPAEGWAAH